MEFPYKEAVMPNWIPQVSKYKSPCQKWVSSPGAVGQ